MAKTKFIVVAAIAALAAMLALSACGGSAASSSAKSSSAAASSSTASSTSSSASAASTLVSWTGALVDGTFVNYVSSDDGKTGAFVLTKAKGADSKTWAGAMTLTSDGKVTITDDKTKEVINFNLIGASKDGTVAIEVEGYGKGAVVPMTAADWQKVAEAEAIAETLGTTVNWVGAFEDGTIMVYMDNESGSKAAVSTVKAKTKETKTWAGNVTTAEGGKVTVTDDKTQQAITLTLTKVAEDGTLVVNSDEYGKGVLVKMTVADWMALDELAKAKK